MTLILFIGILFAQIMGIWIWGQRSEERGSIFSRLPHDHIVLDQLRDMGGLICFYKFSVHSFDKGANSRKS